MNGGRHRSRLRAALFLGVGLATTGLALVAFGTNVFRELELDTIDARFSARGADKAPANIEVVAIDDYTFSDFNSRGLNVRYPFPRSFFAKVISVLDKDGAKVIAYDIQFTERTEEAEDNALIDAVANAGNVVLATTEVNARGETNVFGGDEVVREVRARVGNGNFPTDPGGVIRRVGYSVDKLKSFSLVAAERATGTTITRREFGNRDATWIDYSGPAETIRPFSFSDVYNEKFPKGAFRDKIVVVGPAATSLQDIHSTSTGEGMAGAEIQANAIATALSGFPLRSVPSWLNLTLIILLGLLPPLAGLRLPLLWTLLFGLGAAALYIVATQAAFEEGWVVSFVYPFGTLVLSSVGSIGAHYLLAAFERERVRDVFSRFVPEAVVEQVLARTDDDLRLGGVSLVGTVMFTDLRGFTTFAEALPPARVIECLNVYLEEMTDAILSHGGTLVSYEGDGIMAVFGAPIEQEDHADRAVAAAREMLTMRLPRFNDWLREREVSDGFKMGIGLNTGSIVSGNVGSARRLEYTAIGDTTNTASRLQGMTKGQSHFLFMADSTRELLQSEVDDLVFVDEFEVRGRQGKVKIWSLDGASVEAFEAERAKRPEPVPSSSAQPAR
jgi:adenylate cyclase